MVLTPGERSVLTRLAAGEVILRVPEPDGRLRYCAFGPRLWPPPPVLEMFTEELIGGMVRRFVLHVNCVGRVFIHDSLGAHGAAGLLADDAARWPATASETHADCQCGQASCAACTARTDRVKRADLGPHPHCPQCRGTGEAPNAQFRCACRWSTSPYREDAEKLKRPTPSPASAETLSCGGCGMAYSDFPLDVTIPNEQWMAIQGRPGGVLCANCIVERAAKLPGAVAVRARIAFGSEPQESASPETLELTTIERMAAEREGWAVRERQNEARFAESANGARSGPQADYYANRADSYRSWAEEYETQARALREAADALRETAARCGAYLRVREREACLRAAKRAGNGHGEDGEEDQTV